MSRSQDFSNLVKVADSLYKIQDVNILLETVLHEARKVVQADAGTLYLVQRDRLFFNYIENDTLFPEGRSENKHVYTNTSIPITKESLAGFVASTGKSLIIDDVYKLPEGGTFKFNPEYDLKTKYRTKSLLVVPLRTSTGEVLGVIQLINALDDFGDISAFSGQDRLAIAYFAQTAAHALEKATLSRDMVMRMVEMAELRDPSETTLHARRVGEYSLELYDRYAASQGVSLAERNQRKDIFKTAAILHDVGKVGIDHELLQKPGALTEDERLEMYRHTIYGARLFRNQGSLYDRIAREVILNHHERWDGAGYPGKVKDVFAEPITFGPGKKGKEIPLSARIVAICDVFDALMSKKVYKEAWDEESAFIYLKSKAGKQFDPELVELFINMRDVITAIQENLKA